MAIPRARFPLSQQLALQPGPYPRGRAPAAERRKPGRRHDDIARSAGVVRHVLSTALPAATALLEALVARPPAPAGGPEVERAADDTRKRAGPRSFWRVEVGDATACCLSLPGRIAGLNAGSRARPAAPQWLTAAIVRARRRPRGVLQPTSPPTCSGRAGGACDLGWTPRSTTAGAAPPWTPPCRPDRVGVVPTGATSIPPDPLPVDGPPRLSPPSA